ncbi:motility associated factor glycosyltransferase family protein [Virgibacillus halodenitrificans]|uniref:motility associated factor glycosyltransferase family protein n=1 Tax=Virgibacillus halodenitrificans TaxID=1482 RepID=UPI001F44EBCF|nr:6-hydroxymethylpterin diphosphokinase MptE-like protein [Virgibacillus halodenitrificans]
MLIDNTLLLRKTFPKVREYYRENEEILDLQSIEVMESKAGLETIRFTTSEEKALMVHSLYDPMREAKRIITSHKDSIKENTHVFFYGVGMGYHIEKFQELYPNHTFSLYEPIPEIFKSLTSHRSLNQLITDNIKQLYIDTHLENNTDYLGEFLSSNQAIHLIVLPSYENIAKNKLQLFHDNVKSAITNRRSKLHTDASFQKLWVMNSLVNFKEVLHTPNMVKDIECNNFQGKPALIVSAGPSLAEDIEYIRHIKENNLAYIFSVGSAINSLVSYDILPDAVCTYDPGQLNHKVFEKMVAHGIDHIPMLFGSSVGYETLEKYKGPKVHFITTQDRASTYFLKDEVKVEEDLIIDSPSIAVMTFQILNKLGAAPIIFTGQNLGYLYDRLYSEGIEYDHIQSTMEKEQIEKALATEDVYGNMIKTSHGFNSMRTSIEEFAKSYNGTYINTTKGGAKINGVPFQPIEEVLENVLSESLKKDEEWWNQQNKYDQSGIAVRKDFLKKSIQRFHIALTDFNELLRSIEKYTKLKNNQGIQNGLVKFDTLYNKLNENDYYRHFLSFYIRVHVEIMAGEIRRLNQEKDVLIKGQEIVKLLSRFLMHCKEGTKELEEIIHNTIA